MAETSKIEWTDATFNPWVGCQKVSPGCDHCYAEGWAKRSGMVQWGPHAERRRTSPANWKQPFKWAKEARAARVRRKVFCASLADWLDNRVPTQWREDLAVMIDETPELDWLLLTKRPENFSKLAPWHDDDIPPNVWIGTTAEDQERFDHRWRYIRDLHAVRFISYEPAIGALSLPRTNNPDWVICGGESGAGARHMDPAWARALRDECKAEGIAFFMKQMTGKAPIPDDLSVREFPRGIEGVRRTGSNA